MDETEASPSDLGGERLRRFLLRRRAPDCDPDDPDLTDLAAVLRLTLWPEVMWKTFLIDARQQTATVCPLAAAAHNRPNSLHWSYQRSAPIRHHILTGFGNAAAR